MIDLCYVCIQTVNAHETPTRMHGINTPISFITVETAKGIMDGTLRVVTNEGKWVPLIAMTTINGSRVCANHVPSWTHLAPPTLQGR